MRITTQYNAIQFNGVTKHIREKLNPQQLQEKVNIIISTKV